MEQTSAFTVDMDSFIDATDANDDNDGEGKESKDEEPKPYEDEEDLGGPKVAKWRKAGALLSDYFNYGLDEESWRKYAKEQVDIRVEIKMRTMAHEQGGGQVSTSSLTSFPVTSSAHIYRLCSDHSHLINAYYGPSPSYLCNARMTTEPLT